jgi:asparagine synthase (glutamine-hydrolysing)
MTDVLEHRGPDGRGFYAEGPVGLGHRRLAILDLASGAQPMGSEDGAIWISYNGEVYNYRQLREELATGGRPFKTTSDTEVVLRAYEAWGVDCLLRLRGMFAFAIWDCHRETLFLARDRVGIKPLVYAWDATGLRFGSEIKAILQDPLFSRELDWEAVRDYLVHHYIPAPRTIFRGIRKLPPASYLLCSPKSGEPVVRSYWDLRMEPEPGIAEAEWVARLGHLLDETVRLHMVSDVPIGAFLSGGVDSSAVVASMAQMSATPIKTFSIGFDEANFDELAYARQVAARYGTDHFELVIKPDVMNVLPRLTWQFDEPFADSSAVPTYCVSKITRDHVTVALSGDGGDENFAGYRRYAEALKLNRRADSLPLGLLKPLWRWAAAMMPHGVRGQGFLELLGMSPLDRYYRMMTHQRDQTLSALLTSEAAAHVTPKTLPETFARLAKSAGTEEFISVLQYLDIHHYLPEDILTKVDRTSMLTSLEARVPLLDHVLMEHVATIPPDLKFRDGRGKHILKRVMRERLPAEVLSRPKMGFGVPLAGWFRQELREFTQDVLSDPRTRQRGIFQTSAVERIMATHLRGHRDHSPQLWALICFELWCRTWWDR